MVITTNGSYRLSAVIYDVDKPSHDVDLSSPCSLAFDYRPTATYMNKQLKKNANIRFHSKRPHTITKMNDNINMDITIARSVNAGC